MDIKELFDIIYDEFEYCEKIYNISIDFRDKVKVICIQLNHSNDIYFISAELDLTIKTYRHIPLENTIKVKHFKNTGALIEKLKTLFETISNNSNKNNSLVKLKKKYV